MFTRFSARTPLTGGRHADGTADNPTQPDTRPLDRHGNPPAVNPLLNTLAETDTRRQSTGKSRLERIRNYFASTSVARNDGAGKAAKAATSSRATGATSASASASASADHAKLPAIAQLIHRIKTCKPGEAQALTADLHQALHLKQEPPRFGISAVREMLQSNDWIESIIEGRLDLASLLPVIGKVTELQERRALMGAIEAAITILQSSDPGFAARMQDRLGVPAAAPELRADAVQAKVESLFDSPETRKHIESTITMFKKLGTGTVPAQAVAVNLSMLFNRISFHEEISPGLKAQIMPCLIENLLLRGEIDMSHARVARKSAERVRDYVQLTYSNRGAEADPARLRLPWSCRLLSACIDGEWLVRRLSTPEAQAEIVPINHRFGRLLRGGGLKSIGEDLRKTINEMEASGFLPASTLAQLRACMPEMLEYIYRENCRMWGEPDEARAGQQPPPAEVRVLSRFELMQRLETMDSANRTQLMNDLATFYRTGTIAVEGHAFIRRHGNDMSVLLDHSDLARAVLVRLKQMARS